MIKVIWYPSYYLACILFIDKDGNAKQDVL